jgi:RNA polymerase sigma-70 factor (ECF subfamily)
MMLSTAHSSTCSLPETLWVNRLSETSTPQDQRIIQAQNGDLEAFNELVLLYQDSVYRQARWILNEEEAAEDATQEAFLLAYRKINTFHGGPFRPWLLTIATHCCINQIRAAKRRPCQVPQFINADDEETELDWMKDPGDSPEKVIERTETEAEILRAIQQLAPEYRMAVILVDLQDLNYAEAAGILRLPLGTFKSRLARAREKLRVNLLKRKERI